MQYLNETIVFLSQQNKELKDKVRRLENICKNLTQLTLTHPLSNSNSELDQWQLNSPKSTNNQQLKRSKQQSSTIQSFEASLSSTNFNSMNQWNKLSLEQQIATMKEQLSSLTSQLHQTQLQSLYKSTKIKQLNNELSRCKEQVIYLKKQSTKEKENLKKFYQTVLVQQLEEKFSQEKDIYQKECNRKTAQLQEELHKLTTLIQTQQKQLHDYQKQLHQKAIKEQRMLAILKQMKHLIQSTQHKHQQQLTELSKQLQSKNTQIVQLQDNIVYLNKSLQQKHHHSDLLQIQVKKLSHQLLSIKWQHQRSLSRTQRELQRQRSFSKSVEKNSLLERKVLEAELKKRQESEKYHLRREKQLIERIRQIEANGSGQVSFQMNSHNSSQLLVNNNISSLSSLDLSLTNHQLKSPSPINKLNTSKMAQQNKPSLSPLNKSPQHSFTKYLQTTPQAHQLCEISNKQNKQPKQQTAKNKNTTPKSVVKLKSNTIGMINRSNTNNASASSARMHNNGSFVKTKQKENNTPSTARQQGTRSNLKSIYLKDAKYHQSAVVTEFSLTPSPINNINSLIPTTSYPEISSSEQSSVEINNYSSISLPRDNPSYFPSTKTSKTNSPQKPSPNHNNLTPSNQDKHSFNDEIQELRKLQQYMRTSFNPNHNNLMKTNHNVNGKRSKEFVEQEELINKLLRTEESSSKENNCEKKMIVPLAKTTRNKPQQIEQLLTSTQRHLRLHPNTNPSQNQFTQPFSSVSLTSSHQKQSTSNPIIKKSLPQLLINQTALQSNYKPNKDLMKLADLDTPCFQSSLLKINPNTHRNNTASGKQVSNNSQLPQSIPNSTKEHMQKRKRIFISIANLNSQLNLNK